MRIAIGSLLLLTSAAAGALLGFVLGALWLATGLGEASVQLSAAAVALGALLDLRHLRTGGPRPWSVQRQVPRLWARVFPLPGATILYGLRLGIGPLTHLRSWLWWIGVALGATAGAWSSAALGAAFGGWRIIVQLVVVWRAEEIMASRMAAVARAEERIVGVTLAGVVLLAAAAGAGS